MDKELTPVNNEYKEEYPFIYGYLDALLENLDARAFVEILLKELGGNDTLLLRATKVYNLISDDKFLGQYKDRKIVGLNIRDGLVSIVIE